MQLVGNAAYWNEASKIAFRFVFCFILVYIFPFPLTEIPFLDATEKWVFNCWDAIIPGIGEKINWPVTARPAGSGDTSWNYVQVFLIFGLSVFATFVWTVLDRKRKNYDRLLLWLITIVRFYLAFMMFSYGFAKIFKTQFPYLNLNRFLRPVGELNPMSLTWLYMGNSLSYNIFTGLLEVTAAVLLLFRKTSTFGALLTSGVMANVVMMNFSFDIPVKLFSMFLLLLATFLLLIDSQRLLAFFFRNKAVVPVEHKPLFTKWKWMRAAYIFSFLLVGYYLFDAISGSIAYHRNPWSDYGPKPSLFGIYDVFEYTKNRQPVPPSREDSARWHKLVVEFWGNTLYNPDGKMIPSSFVLDTNKLLATIHPTGDTTRKSTIQYYKKGIDTLYFEGVIGADTIFVGLKKLPLNKLRLRDARFRWVRETTS